MVDNLPWISCFFTKTFDMMGVGVTRHIDIFLALLYVMFRCVFVTFPCGVLGQVWHLIVSIPDLYRLPYFNYGSNE